MIERVYLGGPMRASAGDRDLAWRDSASVFLAYFGIVPVNPARGLRDIAAEEAERTPAEIVTRDLRDLRSSDLLLINWTDGDYASVGTSVEMYVAAVEEEMPVLVVWPFAGPAPVFVQHYATRIYRTLAEALDEIGGYWA